MLTVAVLVMLGPIWGYFSGREDGIFSCMKLLLLFILSGILTVVSLVFDSVRKKRSIATIIFCITSVELIVALFVASITMDNISDNKERLANELIPKIEKYKVIHDKYPDDLTRVFKGFSEKDGLSYHTDSLGQNFTLSYGINDWGSCCWHSESKEWICGD